MLICSIPLQLRMSDSRETPPPFEGASQFEDDDARAQSIRARHAQFIQCLEQHGPNLTGNEWPMMAEELGWSIQEVQLHAYQYLNNLMETDSDPVEELSLQANGGQSNGHAVPPRRKRATQSSTSNATWSLEEALLFEMLVVTYKTTNGEGSNPSGYTWDELVAAQLSGRTAAQVRRRYHQLYGRSPGSPNNHSR
jgi:hypothetical protein